MKRIALLFLPVLWGTTLHAQEDSLDLTPVEVKAVRAGATAPFTKTNIGRAAIEKQNLGQDLPFLLNQVPSVVVNSDAGNGVGYTGIRIRGTDATRINVTLNGVPFNDPESQGSFFVNLPDFASSVNSIQVQRGVGTSSNGAGAFGATINLSTNEVNEKAYAEFNNSYGSFDTWKNTIRAGTGLLKKHFTADLRLSRISSSGYIDRASTNLRSYYFSTAYLADKSSLRLNVFSGREKTYQAWYGVPESDLRTHPRVNYAGTEKPGDPYDNETDNYTQTHYQLFFNHKLAPRLLFNTGLFFIKGKGYYEQYKANRSYADYKLNAPAPGVTKTDLVRQLWLDNDFSGTTFSLQHGADRTQLTFGGAASKYVGSHFGKVVWAEKGFVPNGNYYDLDGNKNDFNVYGKWQQQLLPGLQWFTDLQYRHVGYTTEGFRGNPTLRIDARYNFFNPKAGLSFSRDNWFAYTSYSVANKEPNRDDFEAGVNEMPRPERLNDLELGIERKNTTFNWGATFYYMKYKDQLVLTGEINDVGAYTRTNIEDSYRLGTELQANVVFTKWLSTAANLTLSRNRIRNFSEFIDDYDNGGQKVNFYPETDISFSPDLTGAFTLVFTPMQQLEISLLGKYVGRQYLDNTKNEHRRLDPYFTQDIRAIYSFAPKGFKNISIIAQLNNLFDAFYVPNGYTFSYYSGNQLATENYYFPMAGTNGSVGVNIRF